MHGYRSQKPGMRIIWTTLTALFGPADPDELERGKPVV
jgi:hypothetical protein